MYHNMTRFWTRFSPSTSPWASPPASSWSSSSAPTGPSIPVTSATCSACPGRRGDLRLLPRVRLPVRAGLRLGPRQQGKSRHLDFAKRFFTIAVVFGAVCCVLIGVPGSRAGPGRRSSSAGKTGGDGGPSRVGAGHAQLARPARPEGGQGEVWLVVFGGAAFAAFPSAYAAAFSGFYNLISSSEAAAYSLTLSRARAARRRWKSRWSSPRWGCRSWLRRIPRRSTGCSRAKSRSRQPVTKKHHLLAEAAARPRLRPDPERR